MSYIQSHMLDSLKDHVLLQREDNPNHFVMRRTGSGFYLTHVIFAGGHIIITGDLTIGGPHGCISAGGYGLEWFSAVKSEGYLCSKFLTKTWQWEAAEEHLRWLLSDPDRTAEHRDQLEALLNRTEHEWDYGAPSERECYEALSEISFGYVDDGCPGYDYPRADAGWLCAVNVKFAELYAARTAETAKASA